MILKIRKSDDPILRQPSEKVTDFGHEFQFLIDNMIETMRKNNGVGLAAPQIGISKKFFVCEYNGEEEGDPLKFPLTVICNPELSDISTDQKNMVEGCLSFPGLELLIKRPNSVTIKAQDRYGKPIEIKATDLYARVMQHETDHLNSTLLIDHLQETSVLFIGTGSLGAKSLEMLHNDVQYKIVAVVTAETSKVTSRNKKATESPILQIAKKYKLPIFEVKNINDETIVEKIKALKPDLGIMADFGQIVSDRILGIPKHGIINIHPSLLPKHRGPSPIQQTILDGDTLAGVSLILTSNKMDAGGIISQVSVELSHAETSTTLKDFFADVGATLLLNTIPYYIAGDLEPISQDETDTTYTNMITGKDGFVDENTSGIEVERKIRAFDNWPKVYTIVNDKRIQITAAHLDENNCLVIDRVKPEGKNEMSYKDYLLGYKKELTFR